MNMIPAPADTMLINNDKGAVTPVVGFILPPGARTATPVLLVAHDIGPGDAVLFIGPASNFVVHIASGESFGSESEWRGWMEDKDLDSFVKRAMERDDEFVKPSSAIVFGTKSNKTKSFFHWPEANAIFTIEGNNPLPNDPRIVKIQRTEFAEMKRNGAAVIDPHVGTIQEDETENPQTGAPEGEDDEMDVI